MKMIIKSNLGGLICKNLTIYIKKRGKENPVLGVGVATQGEQEGGEPFFSILPRKSTN
ncbi:hypothetical protein HanOQP8_Chr09g0341511 [Helianthus annuus]|uniref:Uncharacterized protein n=1 Tax=Helianthus annuus TaxID=4232 RepID=A0A251U2J1_HELAN|nr:hypothetical protein HanIR_Chr09g0442351 [Helianthus annuus]KAJ0544135.1 hypothetical protein HanHA89_Chr09g0358231 [Helianthus annuus]KAJ0713053.1 hypothetical protein HanOQP8_Chr09g0341511 [Helianthus annuus]